MKWIATAKSRLKKLVVPVLFFFIAFNLINLTEAVILRQKGLALSNQPAILLGAAIVAKVLIVIDNLPFFIGFRSWPLFFNVIWKTFIYGTTALGVRFITNIFPYLIHSDNLNADYILFLNGMDWTRFWVIQIWFYALFFLFVLFRDITLAIGRDKIIKLLLTRNSNKNLS